MDGAWQEKSHQVGQMRRIYQNAQNVLIWLGPGGLGTDQLFKQMSKLDRRVLRRPRPRTFSTWRDEWGHPSILIPQLCSETSPSVLKEALQDLLSREWFTRVWTIQEAAMARSARVFCGHEQVHSRTFVMMPELLDVTPTAEQQARLDIMPGLRRETSWFSRHQDTKFRTLLERFRSSKATIPHDNVYALMGICNETYRSITFRPDYNINPEAAARNTLQFLLTESGMTDHGVFGSYGQYPGWDVGELLEALPDLLFRLYSWAVQNYGQNLMFDILSAEKARGNVRSLERLAMNPGGLVVAVNRGHRGLADMLLELPGVDIPLKLPEIYAPRWTKLEEQSWYLAIKRREDKFAAELLAADAQDRGIVFARPEATPAELINCGESGLALALLLPHYCDAVDVATKLRRNDLLELVLDQNPKLLGRVETECPSLWTAANLGDEKCVALLLERGADVEAKDFLGNTPLWVAAHNGHPHCVNLLLRHGADVEARRGAGVEARRRRIDTTSLWVAAYGGHSECIELLLSHGADVEAKRLFDDATPLWVAANRGFSKCVELLLGHGAYPIVWNRNDSTTPLEAAVRGGHTECVEHLKKAARNEE